MHMFHRRFCDRKLTPRSSFGFLKASAFSMSTIQNGLLQTGWYFDCGKVCQDGPPPSKSHSESGLNHQGRATGGFCRNYTHHGKPSKNLYCRGFVLARACQRNGVGVFIVQFTITIFFRCWRVLANKARRGWALRLIHQLLRLSPGW